MKLLLLLFTLTLARTLLNPNNPQPPLETLPNDAIMVDEFPENSKYDVEFELPEGLFSLPEDLLEPETNITITGILKKRPSRKGLFLGIDLGIFADSKKKWKERAKYDECMNGYCYPKSKAKKAARRKVGLVGSVFRKIKDIV